MLLEGPGIRSFFPDKTQISLPELLNFKLFRVRPFWRWTNKSDFVWPIRPGGEKWRLLSLPFS